MIENLTITIPFEFYNKLKTDAQRYRDIAEMLYQESDVSGTDKLYFSALSVSAYLRAVDYENYMDVLNCKKAEKESEVKYTNVPSEYEPSGTPCN